MAHARLLVAEALSDCVRPGHGTKAVAEALAEAGVLDRWAALGASIGQAQPVLYPVVRYQVVWLEPARGQFGAPTGKFKQTSETLATGRKFKGVSAQG
jgi:hypothetical protein